jgi:opacity protein-like surface antigen
MPPIDGAHGIESRTQFGAAHASAQARGCPTVRRPAAFLLGCLSACLLAAGTAAAQIDGRQWRVSYGNGWTFFQDHLGVHDRTVYDARIGFHPDPSRGVEAILDHVTTYRSTSPLMTRRYYFAGVGGVLDFLPVSRASIFATGDIGIAWLTEAIEPTERSISVGAGLGARFNLSRRVAARLELRHTLLLSGGVTLAFGSDADDDGDGVTNMRDRCADTPAGAAVDARGCPYDADGDAVLDGIDRCPGTAAGLAVDPQGCALDADGDGVADALDLCPNTPRGRSVDAHGCPIAW